MQFLKPARPHRDVWFVLSSWHLLWIGYKGSTTKHTSATGSCCWEAKVKHVRKNICQSTGCLLRPSGGRCNLFVCLLPHQPGPASDCTNALTRIFSARISVRCIACILRTQILPRIPLQLLLPSTYSARYMFSSFNLNKRQKSPSYPSLQPRSTCRDILRHQRAKKHV